MEHISIAVNHRFANEAGTYELNLVLTFLEAPKDPGKVFNIQDLWILEVLRNIFKLSVVDNN
jgi:hypothetical protein